MCNRLVIAVVFVFSCRASRAGEGDYAVSKIPPGLLAQAHVVKRTENIRFEVIDAGHAILLKKYALTIMDESGAEQAGFMEYYDNLHSIEYIEGILYDANGKELKKLRNKQVIDLGGMDESTLADDSRRKYHHFYYKVYPYTVQYEVEIHYNGTLFFPTWLPREEAYYAVEKSRIQIISPPGYPVRYKTFNYFGEPVLNTEKGKKIMTWEVSGLPAIKNEWASPGWYEMNTVVLFAPDGFEMQQYRGNMNSWGEFGKFVFSLKQGRDELPEKVRQTVHAITDSLNDPAEKIARLYEYLQKNTRYISIQLGIGGWQPLDAKFVAANGYGDCKALANYMYSLLKEAGIYSVYALVKAGRNANKIVADFPSQQFNHVILCVPLQKDTIWLECTSQSMPAGYLGDFTCDRYALLVTEKGGKLVHTPRYRMKENLAARKIKAELDEEGTLRVNTFTSYSGLQQDAYHELIHGLSKDKVKEILHEQLDFATYTISNFDYKETRSSVPVVEETLDIEVSNYASITGKRLFMIPGIMTRWQQRLPDEEERKSDLELGYAYQDVDSAEIILPQGYTAETIPQDVFVSSQFGKFECSVKLTANRLVYYRVMEYYGGRYPAKEYPGLVKFFETIYKADRNKVVLVKNR